ncbi:MAG: YncE family protein, partial [Phycisphaerales bacterium]
SDQPSRVDRDLFVFDISQPATPALLAAFPRMGTTITGMAAHPVRPFILFSNLEPRNTVRLEPNLRGRFMHHEVRRLNLGPEGALAVNPSPMRFNLHSGIPDFDNVSGPNTAAQAAALANPVDLLYDATGDRAFVAALGTDRIGVINAENGDVLSITDVDRGPRALALNSAGGLLYCYCRTDHSVVMLDVTTDVPFVLQRFALFTPEAAVVSEGRHFLYTTKVANNFSSSCAMCHIDGNLDHLAWDLGDNTITAMLPAPTSVAPLKNHPLKGPMVTQSLRGLEKHNAFHWRGDKPEFVDFNSAFDGLLGGAELNDFDMGRYDVYVKSLVYGPNPFFRRDNSFVSPVALAGAATFASACNPCHNFTNDGTLRFVGSPDDVAFPLANLSAQIQEIAQLRGLYKKADSDRFNAFGLLHDGRTTRDGSANAMEAFLETFFSFIPPVDRTNMADTLLSFPGNSMAVVGWQRLAVPGLSDQEIALLFSDVQQMATGAMAAPRHCDVVARGFLNGKDVGFVLTVNIDSPTFPPDLQFMADDGSTTTLTQMLGSVAAGGSLTFMAVPPGSGRRIGIDVDHDGFLNSGPGEVLSANSPDYNRDGFISPDDLDEFITDYFGDPPSPHADFNQDGLITPDDLDIFITEFFRL